MRVLRALSALSLLTLAACDGGTTAVDAGTGDAGVPDSAMGDAGPGWTEQRYCPGSDGCTGTGDDVLYAGAARQEITAPFVPCDPPPEDPSTCTETIDVDMNGDGEYDPMAGDTFHDRDGDGQFDGVWMAGFGNGRGATGVHDPQWARAIALRQNDVTIVMVALDVVGFFKDDMDLIRERIAAMPGGSEIDFVSFTSTHVHEARDTVGLWGITEYETGYSEEYNSLVRERAAQAVIDAVGALVPANVEYQRFSLDDVEGGLTRYISDVRDPVVYDAEVQLMRFVQAGGDTTIATLVNMAAHPEYLDDENTLLSSDYVHFLRDGIENGADGPDVDTEIDSPGVGGIAVFYQGALGSQVGPGVVRSYTWEGVEVDQREQPFEYTAAMGSQIAWYALEALAGRAPASAAPVRDETAELGFRTRSFYLEIENRRYHIGLSLGIFSRDLYNWDDRYPVSGTNLPDVLTEVSVIDIGRTQIITAPGELDPILFLPQGSLTAPYEHTPEGVAIVDPGNPNPPDLAAGDAEGPRLSERARDDAEHVMLFGLTNDFLGYFVPEFDYELSARSPYIDEAEGDHYEETNSAGMGAWPRVRGHLEELLAWRPEGG